MTTHFLKAHYGDATLISLKDKEGTTRNILIDGGLAKSYRPYIYPELEKIRQRNERVDVWIITHYDEDHINGVVKFVQDIERGKFDASFLGEIWFNGLINISKYIGLPLDTAQRFYHYDLGQQIGVRKGKELEDFLLGSGKWYPTPIYDGHPMLERWGLRITPLAPSKDTLIELANNWVKELAPKKKSKHAATGQNDYQATIKDLADLVCDKDGSLANRSSMALLIEHQGRSVLHAGDAPCYSFIAKLKQLLLDRKIDKLSVDVCKLPHHGSKASFQTAILQYINCQHFVISTDASVHNLPNKATLAKILLAENRDNSLSIHFYFNYENGKTKRIFSSAEREQFAFQVHYPSKRYPKQGIIFNF